MKALRILVWAVVLAASGPSSVAQMNVAGITGTVTDPAGDVVPGAIVIASNKATGLKFSAATDGSGQYRLFQLLPGTYSVSASAPGFSQITQDNVVLHAGGRITLPFPMSIGQKTETLIVVSEMLQTESAQIGDVIENRQVTDLPVKERQFLELALLGSGVVNPPGGTRGDSLQQTGKLINVLGQRTGHNLFLVDGVSVTDEYFNNVVINPSPDATREFNVSKASYGAEFGGKSGGVINVITQSGTNTVHGSAYEFIRNDALDARNFFAPPGHSTPFRENQFGAAIGGPVAKNKTFFFLNYDGQRIRDSTAHLFSVPTAAQRVGRMTAPIVNPVSLTPFPNDAINVPLDPAAVALLAKVPLPNLPGAVSNLLAIDPKKNDNNQYNIRIDRRFSLKDSAYLRSSIFTATEIDPFGSSVLNEALLPGFGRNLNTHSVSAAAEETHVFSARVLNEVRFGFLRVSGGQSDPNAGTPFAAQTGLVGTTANPADKGYPQVSLSDSFTTMGSPAGFTSRVDRDFEIYDNVTVQRGAHSFKFGGYFFHLDFNPSFPNVARGLYTYNGAFSGNALADFLLGYPSQAQTGIGGGVENAHTTWTHFYAEDGWKITSDFKLDAGFRYEFNQNLRARMNQTSNIDLAAPGGPVFVVAGNPATLPPAALALAALSPIPVVSAASTGWNDSLLTPRNLRLSPRVGLVWTIPRLHGTVFRSGFGIYTNQAAYSVLQNLAENVPFFFVKTVSNSAKPAYTTENILSFNPTGAVGANGVDHDFAIEYNEVWNAALQRQLKGGTSVEISYIGSRTVHADSATVRNVPSVFGGPRAAPQLAAFPSIRWDGWATFHSLTARLTRRFNHGLLFDSGYTWSKSMDDASDAGTTNAEYNLPQNPFAMRLEKAVSSFDHRRRFTANVIYDIPFAGSGSGWRHSLLAGWRAAGILAAQDGAPFTVNLSSAAGQNVSPIGLVNGNNLERPNLVGDPNSGARTAAQWFSTAAFALPAQNTYGTAGRNVVTGPGLTTLDLSLQKERPLHERLKLQLRFDVYNSLNHANLGGPGRIFGAANFGVISSAGDPRQMQLALKLLF